MENHENNCILMKFSPGQLVKDKILVQDKKFIFQDQSYPINFKLFKRYSIFFQNNRIYKFTEKLVFHYPNNISCLSFENFINACQGEEYKINGDNAFDLLFLSSKFEVNLLKYEVEDYLKKKEIEDYIKNCSKDNNKKESIIIQSLKYKLNLQNQGEYADVLFEQNIIGNFLPYYLRSESENNDNDDQASLTSIPFHILYNIFYTYFNKKDNSESIKDDDDDDGSVDENNNDDDIDSNDDENYDKNIYNQDIFINFLFKTLEIHGRKASTLFSFFDFGEKNFEVIRHINNQHYDFDYNFINRIIAKSYNDLIEENRQIRINALTTINKLGNDIKELNDKIESHSGISLIIQENIIENSKKFNNNNNNNDDDDTEIDEKRDQLQKIYYQDFLDSILNLLFNEILQDIDSKMENKIYLELCRLALKNELDDKIFNDIFENSNMCKRIKDELIFGLSQKSLLEKHFDQNEIEELKNDVEFAKIPSNITSVEPSIFNGFPYVKKVLLHKKVKSISHIESYLKHLEEITLFHSKEPEMIEMLKLISEMKPEESRTGVKASIKFPSGITKIENIFGHDLYLKKLIVHFSLPHSVETISSGAFVSCKSIKSINLPPKIKIIPDRCFSDCSSLTKIKIPKSVEVIEEKAFYHCQSLTKITLPDSIKIIKNSAFEYSGLKMITLPPLLEKIEEFTFSNCKALENVEFNKNLKVIEENAFFECESLNGKTKRALSNYIKNAKKDIDLSEDYDE